MNLTQKDIKTFYDKYSTSELTTSYRIIYTPSEFAKENLFYIQEAGALKSLKSHISQREQLNSYLFLIVLSGCGHATYNDISCKLNPGDCILIDCNQNYSHQSSTEFPWELMWIHFNGKNIIPYITYYKTNNPSSVYHVDSTIPYTSLISSCLEIMKTNDILSEFLLSKIITDLLTLCVTKNNTPKNNKEKMTLIKEYINNNYTQNIALSEISQSFYISKYYLAREFKKFYGVTIGEYINTKRITYSKELLRFTNKSIEEISQSCGISDTNYFAKVFRKSEDCSPSEYRKQW